MYIGEPTTPVRPEGAAPISAIEKSMIFGTPSFVIMMLLGLMSRCRTPLLCE
jgi:hypothetical protein